jgi:hypothetical protein
MGCGDDLRRRRVLGSSLDRARDAATAGLIDAVVALCPERLARNYVHQTII